MSEKEKKEVVKNEVKKESYKLSPKILSEGGYKVVIEDREFIIDFEVDFKGDRVSRFASVCERFKDPVTNQESWKPIKPEVYELEDLSKEQIWVLAHADVILLNDSQAEKLRADIQAR